MRVSASDRQILADCATVVALGAVARWGWDAVAAARTWHPDMMSDGLPLYLGALTVRRGADPTVADALAQTYAALGLGAQAHMFSTLYPASTAALLDPVVSADWATFTFGWRVALLAAAVVAGALGAASGVAPRRWLLAGALGAVATTLAFPTALTCARLGQVNQLLAAGAGISMFAASLGFGGVAVGGLVLGGGLKLVPVMAAWPFVTALRGRALLAGAATGLGVLALTATHVPLARAVDGVLHTLRFQSGTSARMSAGLGPAEPAWMSLLVDARHHPLAVLTVAIAGLAGWRSRAGAGVQPLVGAVALVFAWLGADAAAQHELYLPLLLSALGWAITWPLAEGASRWSLLGTAALVAALVLFPRGDTPATFRSVVFGEVVWGVTAARVLAACGAIPRREQIVLALSGLLALGLAAKPLVVPRELPPEVTPRGGPRAPGGVPPGSDTPGGRHTPSVPGSLPGR